MTAEFAVALPGVVLVLGLVIAVSQVSLAQLRCVDAARAAAREAARGETSAAVQAAAAGIAPSGARISVGRSASAVSVTIAATVPLTGLGPSVAVVARASARSEAAVR